jgi:hypothetical protein
LFADEFKNCEMPSKPIRWRQGHSFGFDVQTDTNALLGEWRNKNQGIGVCNAGCSSGESPGTIADQDRCVEHLYQFYLHHERKRIIVFEQQDGCNMEMVRGHEMLAHSPTMSLLFDENGDLIQVFSLSLPVISWPFTTGSQ